MKSLFTLFFLIVALSSYSQTGNPENITDTSNFVVIHKDPRLDLLVKKQAEVNKITGVDNRKTDKGYRILIISTNNREEAIEAKAKIYTYFSELKAYLWYQSPYFRVKAGNFKDKETADKYKNKLGAYFPKGVFVMKDIVEQKKGKGLNDESED
ncbi:MAG TPA: SPOR domain-containing protein [Chitinophagaceae bacterium]|jgi:hypothetical protein|nr:SPOR domain-containing protein [Chitinophagaceae bacterium]